MSENTPPPKVGEIRINTSGKTVYYKITKLSAAMLWYFECNEHGEPNWKSKVSKIWIKNAALYLGEPLEAYRARKEAKQA